LRQFSVLFLSVFSLFLTLSAPVFADGRPDIPTLVDRLVHGDTMEKSNARYALIRAGGDAVPALIDELKKREALPDVTLILNRTRDPRAAAELVNLLDIHDEEVTGMVWAAIFSLGDASLPYLFDALKDDKRRDGAVTVLAGMGSPTGYPRLRKLLKDPDPMVNSAAARVEKSWLDRDALKEVAALLSSQNPATREAATGYYAALAQYYPMPGVETLLSDTDAAVRANALTSAIKQRTPICGSFTSILAKDPDAGARRLAAEAVFRCCRDTSATPLIAALDDTDETVVIASIGYLGELKAKEAAPHLATFLAADKKPSDAVVAAVAAALASIGSGYDPDIFLPHANWENLYVVKAVLAAWEGSAKPGDDGIMKALRDYLPMLVDNRYKGRVKDLLQKLGGGPAATTGHKPEDPVTPSP